MSEIVHPNHDFGCKCTFCKINRNVTSRIYSIIHAKEILAKRIHTYKWVDKR